MHLIYVLYENNSKHLVNFRTLKKLNGKLHVKLHLFNLTSFVRYSLKFTCLVVKLILGYLTYFMK